MGILLYHSISPCLPRIPIPLPLPVPWPPPLLSFPDPVSALFPYFSYPSPFGLRRHTKGLNLTIRWAHRTFCGFSTSLSFWLFWFLELDVIYLGVIWTVYTGAAQSGWSWARCTWLANVMWYLDYYLCYLLLSVVFNWIRLPTADPCIVDNIGFVSFWILYKSITSLSNSDFIIRTF